MSILKNRKWQIVFAASVVVLLMITIVLAIPKNNESKNNKKKIDVTKKLTEKDVKNLYGMSGNDAINIIKKEYNDNNYEFNVEVNKDVKYEVTVKNKLTSDINKYVVDPSTKNYSIIVE